MILSISMFGLLFEYKLFIVGIDKYEDMILIKCSKLYSVVDRGLGLGLGLGLDLG